METCLSGLWKMPLMFFRLLWAKLYGIMENAPAADVLFGANFPFHFESIILKIIHKKILINFFSSENCSIARSVGTIWNTFLMWIDPGCKKAAFVKHQMKWRRSLFESSCCQIYKLATKKGKNLFFFKMLEVPKKTHKIIVGIL